MTVSLQWVDDKQSILLYEFAPTWTWGDFWEAGVSFRDQHPTIDYNYVDVIMDARHIETIPPNPLENIRRARQQSPNRRLLVIVTSHPYLEALIAISRQIMPRHLPIMRCATLQEAYEIVHHSRTRSVTSS